MHVMSLFNYLPSRFLNRQLEHIGLYRAGTERRGDRSRYGCRLARLQVKRATGKLLRGLLDPGIARIVGIEWVVRSRHFGHSDNMNPSHVSFERLGSGISDSEGYSVFANSMQ